MGAVVIEGPDSKMKYKNIYSAIQNFGHSFLSLMNYVDGNYVIKEGHRSQAEPYVLEFKKQYLVCL